MLQDVVNVSVEQLGVWMGAVANARVLTSGTWDVVCDGDRRIMLDINLIGTWNTCVATTPHLLERGASLVNISSAAGTNPKSMPE